MEINNKKRNANWESIAKEFQSERDALRRDVLRLEMYIGCNKNRMQQERDEARREALEEAAKVCERIQSIHGGILLERAAAAIRALIEKEGT